MTLISNIVLVAAYKSPRTIWPYFTWTENNFVRYVNQEIESRIKAREVLLFESSIRNLDSLFQQPLVKSSDYSALVNHFSAAAGGDLASLQKSHGIHLSICNQLCSIPQMYSYGSLTNHIKWLSTFAEEIHADDQLLQAEGLEGLCGRDLVLTCLRRGLMDRGDCQEKYLLTDDDDDDEEEEGGKDREGGDRRIYELGQWNEATLKSRLQAWLQFTCQVHSIPPYKHPSLLVHAIAVGIPGIHLPFPDSHGQAAGLGGDNCNNTKRHSRAKFRHERQR